MKEYPFSPYTSNEQTFKKYCLQLDKDILSVQDFIDFKNPNYIILNYLSPYFYSIAQLTTLGILSTQDNAYIINTSYMRPGFVLYNNFSKDAVAIVNSDLILEQGYALIKTSDSFYIMPLDAQGDFYILSKYEEKLVWDEEEENYIYKAFFQYGLSSKGTTAYGTEYFFSLLDNNTRFIYWDNSRTHWSSFTVVSWTIDDNSLRPVIYTKNKTLWTDNIVLSYEIMSAENEEIICDSNTTYGSQVFDKRSQSYYTINTNLQDDINYNFTLYLY